MTAFPGLEHRDKARVAFVKRFSDPEGLTATTQFPNAAFEPPDPAAGKFWTRFEILESESRLAELGAGKRWRTTGLMVIQLFAPLGAGERAVIDLAAKLVKVFRTVTVDGVVFKTPAPRFIGRSGDWFQVNVSCPFHYDELG